MSRIWVADLQVGTDVSGVFAVSSIQLRPYANGEFLSLRLADKTGKVSAIFWEGTPELYRRIPTGTLVRIKGKVGRYQGQIQVTLSSLEPLTPDEQVDQSDFLPVSSMDPQVLVDKLRQWQSSLKSEKYHTLWEQFFSDQQWFDSFITAPAGKQWHHAYLGGLLEHTESIVELCDRLTQQYTYLNRDLLLTGALFHDLGKAVELTYRTTFDYTDAGRLIGHINLGVQRVAEYLSRVPDFPQEDALLIQHLILSHQAETPESPRYPRCREAMALNLADMIDSQLAAYTKEMEKPEVNGMRWTPYINLINRHLYRGPLSENEKEEPLRIEE